MKIRQHCWHRNGDRLSGGGYPQICCHCGAQCILYSTAKIRRHGPHAPGPSMDWQSYHGPTDRECIEREES